MRKLLILTCLCLLSSCDLFTSSEVKTQQLVEKELQAINWNDVDQFPLFDDCDETVSKSSQKECFENTLLLHFSMTLGEFEFILDKDVEEAVYVDFLVDKGGKISVLNIDKNRIIQEQIPEFDGIISRSLKSLPPLGPALKRGIPVNAKFRIPIVLNSEETK
ncbi:MAG: hypothetical protein KJO53_09240 [Eudoraea sp.]|nr:hypothetical protein [Eudoraea sp.]NNL02462.1 hypothetical protein [Eudoraea sp.]